MHPHSCVNQLFAFRGNCSYKEFVILEATLYAILDELSFTLSESYAVCAAIGDPFARMLLEQVGQVAPMPDLRLGNQRKNSTFDQLLIPLFVRQRLRSRFQKSLNGDLTSLDPPRNGRSNLILSRRPPQLNPDARQHVAAVSRYRHFVCCLFPTNMFQWSDRGRRFRHA